MQTSQYCFKAAAVAVSPFRKVTNISDFSSQHTDAPLIFWYSRDLEAQYGSLTLHRKRFTRWLYRG